MGRLSHKTLTRAELVNVLRDMADFVEQEDSFEGSIEYRMPLNDSGTEMLGAADFEVRAAYRIGNSRGQGGMRLVGHIAK